ncbi:MAG: hypothetical protein EOO40_06030, partial [Deltaproteobacteria bacterium]
MAEADPGTTSRNKVSRLKEAYAEVVKEQGRLFGEAHRDAAEGLSKAYAIAYPRSNSNKGVFTQLDKVEMANPGLRSILTENARRDALARAGPNPTNQALREWVAMAVLAGSKRDMETDKALLTYHTTSAMLHDSRPWARPRQELDFATAYPQLRMDNILTELHGDVAVGEEAPRLAREFPKVCAGLTAAQLQLGVLKTDGGAYFTYDLALHVAMVRVRVTCHALTTSPRNVTRLDRQQVLEACEEVLADQTKRRASAKVAAEDMLET